jgi:hypothetical protein
MKLFVLAYGVFGVAFVGTPWILLLTSDKSPLHSHEAKYIDGFAMGIGFIFCQLVGVWLLVVPMSYYGRMRAKNRKTQSPS